MNTGFDLQRLFIPFLDPTDMVLCCPADTSLAEINRQAAQHHQRFPLEHDSALSLRRHISAIEHTSHSARFGPYVDNILGMNWVLRSGRTVRVGERVIKSTTGFDLLRFLLHSDGRYGHAADYVVRLRPLGGATAQATLTGDDAATEHACSALLRSPWLHWLDVVDLCVFDNDCASLVLAADCAPGEIAVFQDFFHEFSCEHRINLTSDFLRNTPTLPSLSLKTTVSAAGGLAKQLVRNHGGSARVLCVNGVVHYFPPPALRSFPEASLMDLNRLCTAEGGHVCGPWAGAPTVSPQEAAWASELESAWNQL